MRWCSRKCYANSPLIFILVCAVCLVWLPIRFVNRHRGSDDGVSVDVDTNWLHRRHITLSSGSPGKVLVLSYMRGGSKLVGELFNRDPRTILWHEPMAAFYMARFGLSPANLPQHTLFDKHREKIAFSEAERNVIGEYLTSLLSCHYDQLPPHAWMHKFLFFAEAASITSLRMCLEPKRQHGMVDICGHLGQVCGHTLESRSTECPEILASVRPLVQNLTKTTSLKPATVKIGKKLKQQGLRMTKSFLKAVVKHELCVETMRRGNQACMVAGLDACGSARLHVAKVNRLRLEDVESTLQRNPELFILHYVRDPRAIAASRIERGLSIDRDDPNLIQEAELICQRMRDDIHHRKLLESKYPNTIKLMKYEDLVLEALPQAQLVYEFIGRKYPRDSDWEEFSRGLIHGEKDHLSMRKNGTESLTRWRDDISQADLHKVTDVCQDVLNELNYAP